MVVINPFSSDSKILKEGDVILSVIVITGIEGGSKTPTHHNPMGFGGALSPGASPHHG